MRKNNGAVGKEFNQYNHIAKTRGILSSISQGTGMSFDLNRGRIKAWNGKYA